LPNVSEVVTGGNLRHFNF